MSYPHKFVADAMLGSLAKWLRAIGYDTVYLKDVPDRDVVACALKDNRTILSRDHHFEKMKTVKYLILIESTTLSLQFQQVVQQLHLDTQNNLFTRCMECNHILESIDKSEIRKDVPPYVFKTVNQFSHCPNCHRVYWEGTHLTPIRQKIQKMLLPLYSPQDHPPCPPP